jgi:preprotein translocase subunit SecA
LIEKVLMDYKNSQKLTNDILNLPYSLENSKESFKELYSHFYEKVYTSWQQENKFVKDLGGLFVLGTERHETRRIDNQLRGRSGRQGDPGNSQFFVSLEDELIKVFGGDSIRRWVEYLIQDKDVPLESNLLTKSLENAQKKVELYNYDLRKNVFQYDDILNTQRKQLFKARNEILRDNIFYDLFLRSAESFLDEEITQFEAKSTENKSQTLFEIETWFDNYATYSVTNEKNRKNGRLYEEIWISNDLRHGHSNIYQLGFLTNTRSMTILTIMDCYWTEHLERMSYIRETISWRSYGQQNPLSEYSMEAFKSFKLMFQQIRSGMLYYFLSNPIN